MWRPLLSVAVCAVGVSLGMGNSEVKAGGYLYSPYGYSPYSAPVFAAPVPVGLSAPVVATYYAPAPVYAAPAFAMPVEPVPVIVPQPYVVPAAYYVAPRAAVTRVHYGPFGGARAVTRLR